MSKGRWVVSVGIVLVLTWAASAAFVDRSERSEKKVEKPTRPSPPPEEMPKLSEDEMRDVVNVLEFWTLTDKLELSDAQLVSLIPKYRRLKAMRERFWQSRPERYRALEEQMKRAGANPAPEQNAQLRTAFEAFEKESQSFWQEHEKARQEILKELTPRQQVAYLIWESESPRKANRILRALRRMGEMRHPPRELPSKPESSTSPEPR